MYKLNLSVFFRPRFFNFDVIMKYIYAYVIYPYYNFVISLPNRNLIILIIAYYKFIDIFISLSCVGQLSDETPL